MDVESLVMNVRKKWGNPTILPTQANLRMENGSIKILEEMIIDHTFEIYDIADYLSFVITETKYIGFECLEVLWNTNFDGVQAPYLGTLVTDIVYQSIFRFVHPQKIRVKIQNVRQ